jgi:hypothetical protein
MHANEIKKCECTPRHLYSFARVQKYLVLVFRTIIDQSCAQKGIALFERMVGPLQQEGCSFVTVIVVIKRNHNGPIASFLPQSLCGRHNGRQGAHIPTHLTLLSGGVKWLTGLERPGREY